MVQTGHQAGEQSPTDPRGVSPWSITAEADVAYSGRLLINAILGLYSGCSTRTLRGVRADGESVALQAGTGSPTLRVSAHEDEHDHTEGAHIPWNDIPIASVLLHKKAPELGSEVASWKVSIAPALMVLWGVEVLSVLPSALSLVNFHKDTPILNQ